MSQNSDILKHLKSGHTITARQASRLFNADRLAARIEQLRQRYNIKTVMIKNGKKRFAKYILKGNYERI